MVAVVVWGSDLLRWGSVAAEVGGAVLRVDWAAAAAAAVVPNLCANAEVAVLSLPADSDACLSGTSVQDRGWEAGVVNLAGLMWLVVVGEATHWVFCLFGESWGDWRVGTCLEGKGTGSAGGTSEAPPLDGFCSLVLNLTGPRTLLATVASWDTTLSTPLSEGGTGDPELELELEEDEGEVQRLAAAAAAHSLRLSASFFSLGMPGDEQEVRAVSRVSVVWHSAVLVVVLESVVFGVPVELSVQGVVILDLSIIWPSALGSDGTVFPMTVFESFGGAGLIKVSLLTEMNALPGVEKGRGPWMVFVVLLGSRTFLSRLASSSVDEAKLPSVDPWEQGVWLGLVSATGGKVCEWLGLPTWEGPVWLNVAWGVQGERQRDGSVPPGPVLTVVGLRRGGGVDIFPLRPSWLSSEPSSVSSSDESTSWMASCFCRDSLRSALSCLMADSLSFSLLFPADRPSEPDTTPSVPSPSCRPNFLDEEECLCRLPFSTPRPAEDSRPSLDDS